MTERRKISNQEYFEAYHNEDNVGILNNVSNKFVGQLDRDTIEECKDKSLWRALQYHNDNHESGQKFTTSLYRFAMWEFLREVDKVKPSIPSFSIDNYENIPSGCTEDGGFTSIMLRDCIDKLPNEQQKLIQYKFFDNMTLNEIAEKVNRSRETVRNRLEKAIVALRDVYFQGENNE